MKSISYFVWQKRKLSDKPVEAGEDYTKFNSAEFVRKVSVYRAVCKSFLCFHPWFSSQSFFFGRPSVIGSVASLTLAFFKLCLGQSGSLCGNMLFLSLNWSLQHIMNSLLSLCKVVELSCWFFSSPYSSRPRRWVLLRKVWRRWTRLAWSLCLPSSAPRSKQKRNECCTVSGFLIKKIKCSWHMIFILKGSNERMRMRREKNNGKLYCIIH